jgi:serine/threonine-protein kinase
MKLCPACSKTFDDAQTFCPVDGEVLQESPEQMVGRVIDGKYQVEGFIAQGGMGAVYRARHILLGDQVVIKTLRPEMRGNAEWLKRFQREGKAARAFRHPNSVTVYDLSAGSDGLIYMVMEYVEGHTLDRELTARGRFTPRAALAVLEPVADVLDAAHARGVVHRDLKPENIMLGRDDHGRAVVKVLDLGIAKMVGAGDVHASGATSLTVAGQLLGTPYYMSPEQWGEMPRDGNPEVDGRTDIYSLGVIFFEMVAGRKPQSGRTLAELRQKHVAAPTPSLCDAAPGVPEEFGGWVARALSKDRADRPQTAGELIDGLRSSLGLPARAQGRGVRLDGVGAGAHALEHGAGEAATAPVYPETAAHGSADTILTSDFDPRALRADGARDTSAQRRASTGGSAAALYDASRDTLVDHSADTHSDAEAEAKAGAARPFARETARASSADAPQAPARGAGVTTPMVPAASPAPRNSLAPFVAGGALALLLLACLGGWLLFKDRGPTPAPPAPGAELQKPPAQGASGAAPNVPAAPPKAEAASYWFEALEKDGDEAGRRVAEPMPVFVSGQRFRIHFTPKERGYLYIIGPNKNGNAQTTFLTARGGGTYKSNLVGAGSDFSFPGAGRMKLDPHRGADEFTLIFSAMPLTSPAFLMGESLKELTPAEVSELEEFRAQFKSDAPSVGVVGDGAERRVVVSAPSAAEGRPLIFDLRINHQ